MKIAITADWLNSFGGGERVLLELRKLYPEAPIFTSVYRPDRLPPELQEADVRTSFLQKVPFARRRHDLFFPLMPVAFEQFDFGEYDVVLSTSSACAKGALTGPGTASICYSHTPCRYLWDLYHEYTHGRRGRGLIAPMATALRVWDRLAADRVDHFVAISHEVAARIAKAYRREAEVIYPPVDTTRFSAAEPPSHDGYYLVVSRLVRYKRIDLAIEAANRTGRRLVVVGDGPERRRLQDLAGPTVSLLGWRSDAEVTRLYERCRAFIFPGWEDFGIAPVEAQAAGRPVLAYGRGGALETVVQGKTGLFFEEQAIEAVCDAIHTFESGHFDPTTCRRNAERFDAAEFRRRIREAVDVRVRHRAAEKRPFPDRSDLRETA